VAPPHADGHGDSQLGIVTAGVSVVCGARATPPATSWPSAAARTSASKLPSPRTPGAWARTGRCLGRWAPRASVRCRWRWPWPVGQGRTRRCWTPGRVSIARCARLRIGCVEGHLGQSGVRKRLRQSTSRPGVASAASGTIARWHDVFLPSTAGPGPTGPGVPGQPGAGRRTVDSTALVITLLIVLLVVIDRVVRR